jgi:hypothetical protein
VQTLKARQSFIRNLVENNVISRRRGNSEKFRKNFFVYKLKDENNCYNRICQKFFLNTMGLAASNNKMISRCFFKKNNKKIKRSVIDEDILKNHILSYNPQCSHYRRVHAPNRLYLPSDLTIKKMVDDFNKGPIKSSYGMYRKNVAKLNISFARLGHEECDLCEIFFVHCSDSGHSKMSLCGSCSECSNWNIHIQKAGKSRSAYKEDSNRILNESEVVVSVDLEKVIMLPRMDSIQRVIFSLRLSVYNESFVPVGTKRNAGPFAVLWHERTTGRNKEDIMSAFYQFLIFNRDAENITIWLDNCSAQNKNWALLLFFLRAINSTVITAKKIELKYLVTGHSFMSADSFHHQVEKSLNHNGGKVYDFQDFVKK